MAFRRLTTIALLALLGSGCQSGRQTAQRAAVKSDSVQQVELEPKSAAKTKKAKAKHEREATAPKSARDVEQVDNAASPPAATAASPLSKLISRFGKPQRVTLPRRDDSSESAGPKPGDALDEL